MKIRVASPESVPIHLKFSALWRDSCHNMAVLLTVFQL